MTISIYMRLMARPLLRSLSFHFKFQLISIKCSKQGHSAQFLTYKFISAQAGPKGLPRSDDKKSSKSRQFRFRD